MQPSLTGRWWFFEAQLQSQFGLECEVRESRGPQGSGFKETATEQQPGLAPPAFLFRRCPIKRASFLVEGLSLGAQGVT